MICTVVSRLAVVADIHAKPETLEELRRKLRALCSRLETEVRPELVIVLGDLVHGTDDSTADRATLTAVVETFSNREFDVRFVPGNHDVETLDRSDLRAVFGHDLWTISEELIVLDSSMPGATGNRGEVGAEQRQALEARVGSLSSPLVFVHHPLGFRRTEENRWFHDRPEQAFCGDRVAVNELLAEIDPVFVVNGHLHWCDHVVDGGVHHFTVDSFDKSLEPVADGAFAVIDLDGRPSVRLVEGSGFEHRHVFPDPQVANSTSTPP